MIKINFKLICNLETKIDKSLILPKKVKDLNFSTQNANINLKLNADNTILINKTKDHRLVINFKKARFYVSSDLGSFNEQFSIIKHLILDDRREIEYAINDDQFKIIYQEEVYEFNDWNCLWFYQK